MKACTIFKIFELFQNRKFFLKKEKKKKKDRDSLFLKREETVEIFRPNFRGPGKLTG